MNVPQLITKFQVLDTFYDNWFPLDSDKLEDKIKPMPKIAEKPVFKETNQYQIANPSSSSNFVEVTLNNTLHKLFA
jgi:hypothetical protein